ncbi:alpha/beta hydrolase [Chroococcidiopsis sp. CCALA 051]|nr:alpha/beta hydrolase [Chroococcidiopsis sp. CCALA 051]
MRKSRIRKLRTTHHSVTNYQLPITHYPLPISNFQFTWTNYKNYCKMTFLA